MKPSSREAELSYRRVWEINELLIPKPSDFVSASRFFIREGDLLLWDTKLSKKLPFYVFLFNDILLITSRKKRKFRLRVFVTLRTPSVNLENVDTSSHNYEFRLHCRTKSFNFYCESSEERKKWMKDIQASISGSHQEELDTRKIHQDAREYTVKELKDSYSAGNSSDSDSEEQPKQATSGKNLRKSSQGQKKVAPNDPMATNPFVSANATSPFANGIPKATSNPGVKNLTTSNPGEKKI